MLRNCILLCMVGVARSQYANYCIVANATAMWIADEGDLLASITVDGRSSKARMLEKFGDSFASVGDFEMMTRFDYVDIGIHQCGCCGGCGCICCVEPDCVIGTRANFRCGSCPPVRMFPNSLRLNVSNASECLSLWSTSEPTPLPTAEATRAPTPMPTNEPSSSPTNLRTTQEPLSASTITTSSTADESTVRDTVNVGMTSNDASSTSSTTVLLLLGVSIGLIGGVVATAVVMRSRRTANDQRRRSNAEASRRLSRVSSTSTSVGGRRSSSVSHASALVVAGYARPDPPARHEYDIMRLASPPAYDEAPRAPNAPGAIRFL